ncbi:MAG: hypothetical protein NZM31_04540 [Gemmatales bacterium]|nr:hypothetical protein [Gemmatales bacterium]MDW8386269.1 hypothetical protein [Gemmatales bacterium]
MSEPGLASAPPAEETYKPLSLLAVIGLGVSLLSLLIYLFASEWLIFLPALGFLLSAVALYRIKRSDSALAGAAVARAGMALGLVVGLSWLTMQITMTLVLEHEASEFVEHWLECVRDGKDALAFIATTRPGNRPAELTAEDLEPRMLRTRYASPFGSAYDFFLASPIAELLLRGGKDISWQRLGIQEYFYYEGSWYFKHRYRIKTPEVEADFVLVTVSDQVDRPSGPRREWRVDIHGSKMLPDNMVTTPYGLELTQARSEAFRIVQQWISYVAFANKEKARELLERSPLLEAEFDRLYTALRHGDAGTSVPVLNRNRQPLVLRAVKDGTKWHLTLRTTVETGQREVDCQFALETPDLNSEKETWRIVDLKYLGDRKRQEMTPPEMPIPSDPK